MLVGWVVLKPLSTVMSTGGYILFLVTTLHLTMRAELVRLLV